MKQGSEYYPTADYLRSITVYLAIEAQASIQPKNEISEGAKMMIKESKNKDPRPLYVLVWDSMTDIAQAMHTAPEIKTNIRVYSIGSFNTKRDTISRNYVLNEQPDLYFIKPKYHFPWDIPRWKTKYRFREC